MENDTPNPEPPESPATDGTPAIKLNIKRSLLIGLGFMTTAIAWTFYNFQIPLVFRDFLLNIPDRDLIIGFLMTLDNIIAVPVQPFFGALSDRLHSKIGRRMPFITIGIIGAAIFFIIAPFMPDFASFLAVIICFNVMMALYRAPVVALMPDMTPAPVRSKGNALINLMGGVGTILGYVIRVVGSQTLSFILVSVIMLVSLAILFLTIKETPTGTQFFQVGKDVIHVDPLTQELTPEEQIKKEDIGHSKSRWGDLRDIAREKEKSGLWMLLSIFMLVFAYNALETFYSTLLTQFYLNDAGFLAAHAGLTAVQLADAAQKSAATLTILLPVMFIIATIPGGILGEKIGRRLTIKIGLVIMIAASVLILIFPQLAVVPILVSVAGIGYGFVNVNTIVVIWQLAPKGRIGSYTGVYYLFSILAQILSPPLIGGIFSLEASAGLPSVTVYLAIFPYVIVCIFLSLLFIMRVKRGEAKLSKQELVALRLQYEEDD
ncbi:MAG TPA: MFS transporter [Candidatus Lokiarchaeia archaeon]|nr:MFS transporter [Candidatus Lokiarchaeia archaeon]